MAGRGRPIAALADALRRGGWRVDTAETSAAGGARDAASRGLRETYDVLVACGGDGTVNQVAHVVASASADDQIHPLPWLGVVPWGTANILAGALGVPGGTAAAARWLLRACPRLAPLGVVRRAEGDAYFLAVASIGLDAAVVHGMRWPLKRRWGALAYAGAALTGWPNYFPASIQFELETAGPAPPPADGLILSLTPYYGGKLRLGRVDADGAIRLALRGAPGLLLPQVLCLATIGLDRAPGVERLPPVGLSIITPGRPLELDGEPAGHTPARIFIRPRAIALLGA